MNEEDKHWGDYLCGYCKEKVNNEDDLVMCEDCGIGLCSKCCDKDKHNCNSSHLEAKA